MTGKKLPKLLCILSSAVLALTACSAGPDYAAPAQQFLSPWSKPQPPHTTQDAIQEKWWSIFKDPLLEQYIHQAIDNNKDIKIALANLRAARAARQEATAGFFPALDAGSGARRSKSSEAAGGGQVRNLYDAGFDASWEIDIFGGQRRTREAATARMDSAEESYHAVILATLSEVARTYYEVRGLQKRIGITEKNTDLLHQTYQLVSARMRAGEASEFDLARAQGEYELIRARMPNLTAGLHADIFRLSILLGQAPETLLPQLQEVTPLPAPPDTVPVGLRGDILRRRPDVRGAERDLAATVADIGVETAELFPKFSLTGDIGTQARVFGDVFSATGGLWSLAAIMQWRLFDGGARQARIAQATAKSEAALARYEKIVLTALADAETALIRYGQELETRKRLAQGVASRRRAVTLARELFDAGEQDFLAVLDAEREMTGSEDALVLSETESVIKMIALVTALGGGWEDFPPQKSPAPAP